MQPKDFLYFLVNKDGASYYQNNGVVDTSTTPKPLDVTPDGWQDVSIKWERNTKYFGLFRSFTTPLKFVLSAAKTLRNRLYTYGTEDRVYLLILWLDKTFTGGWVHRTFYKGELDLSQTTDELTHIETNVMEGDLVKLFKSAENTTYSLPIDGPLVKDDGLVLFQKGNFFIVDGLELKKSIYGTNFFVPIAFKNTDGVSTGIDFTSQEAEDVSPYSFADKIIRGNTFAAGNSNITTFTPPILLPSLTATISGTLKFQVITNDLPFGFRFRIITSELTIPTQFLYEIPVTGSTAVGTIHEHPFSFDIPVQPGTKIHLECIYVGGTTGAIEISLMFLPGSDFSVAFSNRFKATYTPCITLMQAGQKLVEKIAGAGYTFSSNHFSTIWSNLYITSGDAIRGIADAKLKTSWSDFFESTNVPCNIQLSIQDKTISIEPKATAFDATIVQQLGEVGTLKVKTSKDSQFSGFAIGYPNIDTHSFENLNAKEEFNVTSRFTSVVARTGVALEIISKYKASMYEQELARINLEGKTTTADSGDTDVFFKHVEKTATTGTGTEPPTYYKLLRETYDSITGLLDPGSAFNIGLSPKRCLISHGNYLRSIFYWQEGTSLTFQTSDQNPLLKTVKAGVTIQENADVPIGSLASPLFIPLDFEISCPMARDIVATMKNTPAGTFSFTWLGNTYYGFAKSIGIQPANRPVQESTLICSPQSDILKLIH